MHVVDRMIEPFAAAANATPGLLSNLSLLIQDIVFSYRKEMSDKEALSSLRTFYARLMTCALAGGFI
jgi:hypothetical protein